MKVTIDALADLITEPDASVPMAAAAPASMPFDDIAIRECVDAYIPKNAFSFKERAKHLGQRVIRTCELVTLHLQDSVKLGGYCAVWAMSAAAFAVASMAVPIIFSAAMFGVGVMFCEAVGEAFLRYLSEDNLRRFPIRLDKIPLEKVPVIGNFLSFKPLKKLPFMGDHVKHNRVTFLGSRLVAGAVYGALAGLVIACASLTPTSILTAGVVTGLVVSLAKSIIYCLKVIPDFMFLTNHEINENHLYYKKLYKTPIKERVIKSLKSVVFDSHSDQQCSWVSPKNGLAAAKLLGINCDTADDLIYMDKALVRKALNERLVTIVQRGVDETTFYRFFTLFKDARMTLERAIDDQIKEDQINQERRQAEKIKQQAAEQEARKILGLSPSDNLSKDLVEAGFQDASQQFDRFIEVDKGDIKQARQILLDKLI